MNARALLNDQFRKTCTNAVYTTGVLTNIDNQLGLAQAIDQFSDFTYDNDPWDEHEFGSLLYEGNQVFWKIDYYDQNLVHWCDPLDERCRRVITVMMSWEY